MKHTQEGDEESLIEFLNRFNPLIKKFSNQLRYEEAESDLIISFIEIMQNLELNSSIYEGRVVRYLYRSLQNKKIDLFRKYVKGVPKEVEINLNLLAEKNSYNIDNIILINELLRLLTQLQREVIKEEFFEGYSEKEIGEKHHISRQAVNRIKNRALERMRRHLAI